MDKEVKSKMYEEISEWVTTYHSSSDENEKNDIKSKIVVKMAPIIKNIAYTIARRKADPIEDMVQAGFIGLLKALDRFDCKKNDNFRIYAGYLIIGEMKHYLRDRSETIRIPCYIQELCIRINNFTKNLNNEEIYRLTDEDVAKALKIPKKAVEFIKVVEERRKILSLDEIYKSGDETRRFNYTDVIAYENEAERAETKEYKTIFNMIIDKLPDEEKIIIEMHYRQNMSKKEIASALNLTKMSVTRRFKSAFDNLTNIIIESQKEDFIKELLKNEEN